MNWSAASRPPHRFRKRQHFAEIQSAAPARNNSQRLAGAFCGLSGITLAPALNSAPAGTLWQRYMLASTLHEPNDDRGVDLVLRSTLGLEARGAA